MKRKKIFLLSMLLAITAIIITGCLYWKGQQQLSTPENLEKAYQSAIENAKTAKPAEISRNLTAINKYNNNLIWEGQPGESPVLVITWTSWDGYNNKNSQSLTAKETWVTVAPEIKEFCTENNISDSEKTLRLEQLLGLPSNDGKKWFVEIWANPSDLFRPSPDSDITDHEAELDFPANTPQQYIDWFNNLKNTSYGVSGYPWTRLGYTYDWGNTKNNIGLSEFVIKNGADIKINSVSTTSDYCK